MDYQTAPEWLRKTKEVFEKVILPSNLFAEQGGPSGPCLFWAVCSRITAKFYGVDISYQAGSMSWPAVRYTEEEGGGTDNLEYIWSPDTVLSSVAIAQGMLPEVHVWTEWGDRMLDLSGEAFPLRYASLGGKEWSLSKPPAIIYGHTVDVESVYGCSYTPNLEALYFVQPFLRELERMIIPSVMLFLIQNK